MWPRCGIQASEAQLRSLPLGRRREARTRQAGGLQERWEWLHSCGWLRAVAASSSREAVQRRLLRGILRGDRRRRGSDRGLVGHLKRERLDPSSRARHGLEDLLHSLVSAGLRKGRKLRNAEQRCEAQSRCRAEKKAAEAVSGNRAGRCTAQEASTASCGTVIPHFSLAGGAWLREPSSMCASGWSHRIRLHMAWPMPLLPPVTTIQVASCSSC